MRSIIRALKRRSYLLVASYFRFWAEISLSHWNPRIIAVTGSVGKTTMLHLLEDQIGGRAHYSHLANSIYGICFDIVGLHGVTRTKLQWLWLIFAVPFRALTYTRKQTFYIVEIDADRPKEAEYISKWLQPEVTLWVSLGRSHAANFDRQVDGDRFKTVDEAIAYGFAGVARHTKNLVIYDGDNNLIDEQLFNIKAERYPITSNILKSYEVWPSRTVFKLDGGEYKLPHPVPKEIYKQLAMLEKTAEYMGIKISRNFENLQMPPGRNNFFKGIQETQLIDSSYNAHLISMQSMIEMFDDMQAKTKWIVIGDITELGESEAGHHKQLGEMLATAKFDKYILVGRRTKKYTLPVLKKLGKSNKTLSLLKMTDATDYIKENIKGGETILFKGSQYLESIVESMLLNPSDADKLPRRELLAKKRRMAWESK